MVAAYGHPRTVRVDGLGGHALRPRCGLALGCPAATDWLALVAHVWRGRLRQLAPALSTCACVDDMVAYSSGPEVVEAVDAAWTGTCQFGQASGLGLNEFKSVRLGATAEARSHLRARAAPRVVSGFRDLGVDLQVGARRQGQLSQERLDAARLRFARCGRLALPWRVRVRVAAASGLAPATFGAGVELLPERLVGKARQLALQAALRSRFRVAPEALSLLHQFPWRADPAAYAAIAPWPFLLQALRLGHLSAAELRDLLEVKRRQVGPVAAAARGLRWAGVLVADRQASWTGAHWRTLLAPLEAPRGLVLAFLHASWQAHQWRTLSARRPTFPAALPDVWAIQRSLRQLATPVLEGALRAVLTGGLVSQAVARKWTGFVACPHYGAPEETDRHRFMERPTWAPVRAAAPGAVAARLAPDSVRATGILPLDPELADSQCLAEGAQLPPAGTVTACVAYTTRCCAARPGQSPGWGPKDGAARRAPALGGKRLGGLSWPPWFGPAGLRSSRWSRTPTVRPWWPGGEPCARATPAA